MTEHNRPQGQPQAPPKSGRHEGTMKREHRMEARAPDPDDLTSEDPVVPSAIRAQSGGTVPGDVSAPHIPPVEDD